MRSQSEDLWEKCCAQSLNFIIAGHPTSANQMWRKSRFGMFKTKEAKLWEDRAEFAASKAAIKAYGTTNLASLKGRPLSLEISICRPSWTGKTKEKKGLYVRPDISNFIKSCEDAVMRALGLDDSAVVEITALKVVNELELTMVSLVFVGGENGV